MKKLAIVTTHPIQYHAPWFRLLSERKNIEIKVFYTWSQLQQGPKYDPDFKQVVEWDIPLLEGYDYEFVENISKEPGSHHFKGIVNPSLNKVVGDWKPDAVLVIGWAYKSHLKCMRHFKGKLPVIFRGDSTLLDETKGVKTLLRRIFLRWVYKHVDVALYAGTNNKAYFKTHGLNHSQLILAPHAIDNDRFSVLTPPQQEALQQQRNNLNIKAGDFVILFAGKLEEKKNPFFLQSLAKRLKYPGIIFLFTGNGHLEEELKLQAANDPRIKFLDFQNQSLMPVVYALATVFILPSKGPGETWGLAANEAMAAGLPVILSSKAGGSIDLVNENGIVFHPDDIDKVRFYIEELKASPAKLDNAKKASLHQIKKFSFSQIAEAAEKACGL